MNEDDVAGVGLREALIEALASCAVRYSEKGDASLGQLRDGRVRTATVDDHKLLAPVAEEVQVLPQVRIPCFVVERKYPTNLPTHASIIV